MLRLRFVLNLIQGFAESFSIDVLVRLEVWRTVVDRSWKTEILINIDPNQTSCPFFSCQHSEKKAHNVLYLQICAHAQAGPFSCLHCEAEYFCCVVSCLGGKEALITNPKSSALQQPKPPCLVCKGNGAYWQFFFFLLGKLHVSTLIVIGDVIMKRMQPSLLNRQWCEGGRGEELCKIRPMYN